MRLVLFDLDGTLIDSETGIVNCIGHALRTLGAAIPPRAQLRDWIGPPLRATLPRVLGDDAAAVERAIALYRERFATLGWREHEVYAGVGAAIGALATSGAQLAVVTSKPDTYAARIVASLPFGAHFAHTYAPAADSAHCDKNGMIARALADFGVAAAQAAMVGDRSFDMRGARANGVRAIGAGWGFGSREELTGAGADAIAAAPDELVALLLH